MNLIKDINEGNLKSAYVDAPFDKGKTALETEGYKIISAQETARLRIQKGVNSSILQLGNWIREGVLYIPKKGKFITKKSPILDNAKEATDRNKFGVEFYLNPNQIEEALLDSIEISDESAIPTDRFADNEITNYLFGEDAKAYGEFLREVKIKEMPVWLVNLENKPFAKQLWLHFLGSNSGIYAKGKNLGDNYRVRGVSESGEAITQRTETIPIGKLLNPWDIEIPKYDNLVFGGRR